MSTYSYWIEEHTFDMLGEIVSLQRDANWLTNGRPNIDRNNVAVILLNGDDR